MSNDSLAVVQFWQEVFHDVKEWYKIADSKAAGIIAINSIILTITTFGLGFLHNDVTNNKMASIISVIFICFLGTILSSVILSVIALWARIKIISHIPSTDLPVIFFAHIADKYPTSEDTLRQKGMKFFDFEMPKALSDESKLKAMAEQITILSSNVRTKYIIINFSYLLIIISLVLLAGMIVFRVYG
jgi:hypothetical protein